MKLSAIKYDLVEIELRDGQRFRIYESGDKETAHDLVVIPAPNDEQERDYLTVNNFEANVLQRVSIQLKQL